MSLNEIEEDIDLSDPNTNTGHQLEVINTNQKKQSLGKSNTFTNRIDYSLVGINHFVSATEKRDGKKVKYNKQILTDINAHVQAGEMIGILGPSGAGKSTLLDIVAHRLPINGSGKLLLNGIEAPHNVFRKLSGYVTQSDTLTPAMTVRETLSFYAQLKMPKDVSYEKKMERVEEVIAEMGLSRCANTLIGGDKIRGVSGGERRRVTIAIELLTGPSLLFLDEPSSGLDASTSYSVIKSIRKLATSGRTVICTIHQPRSNIFDMFDKLLLLGEGSIIYYGDAKQGLNYFREKGYECDPSINPADFFLDLINTQIQDQDDDDDMEMSSSPKRVKALNPQEMATLKKEYSDSRSCQELKQQLSTIEGSKGELVYSKSESASMFTQYKLLLYRESINIRRDPMASRIQVMNSIFQGLLCGLVYYQLGVGQTSIQSRTGVIAFLIMGLGFPSVMMTLQVFPQVIQIFLKDKQSGTYKTLPFFLAKSTTDVIMGIITPIIMGTIVYWMTNQRIDPFFSAAVYFRFVFILVMASQVALSFGVLISSAVPNIQSGLAIAPPLVILFFLFSGFFINLHDVPRGWIWMPPISFFKYLIEAAVVNAFKGIKFSCHDNERIAGQCPTQTGEQVIDRMDYNIDAYWRNVWVVLIFIFGFRVLAFLVLSFRSRDRFSVTKTKGLPTTTTTTVKG